MAYNAIVIACLSAKRNKCPISKANGLTEFSVLKVALLKLVPTGTDN
jgi:hypothetical protein